MPLKRIVCIVIGLIALSVSAQNPISPQGVYIADPTARVDSDGRLYIYGSLDESPDYYCSQRYHVLSSSDLRQWTLHRDAFSWKDRLYAPDLIRRDSTYYLYFDDPQGHEFVASGSSPTGPFTNATHIDGPQQIDPNIFIDDDGQAYYFWGQFAAKGAKMNADMRTLDLTTLRDSIVTERDHHFHEGSYVVKRGPYYYFLFADISRRGRPTSLGYAMSTQPLGPYEYKGIIIDNYGCDPETWNNHGSLVEYKGQWYVLYHRSTHSSRTMRKACIEPITFNADGTINEVEMTSQGAAPPLDAFARTDAFRACLMHGAAIEAPPQPSLKGEGVPLAVASPSWGGASGETPGAAPWALWRYLDFGRGARRLTLCLEAHAEGKIVVLADSLNGRRLGEVNVKAQDGWQEVSMRIRKIRGVHALYLRFEPAATAWAHLMQRAAPSPYGEDRGGAPGESAVWLHLNWFLFGKK
ncbi:MAG: family 43 glycosylhydrolase [Prevotella sp.]|nr:family 43 glycosylhydrolase [Prevotella sp.]